MALPANINTPAELTAWVAAHYAGPLRAQVYAQLLPAVRQRTAPMPGWAAKFKNGGANPTTGTTSPAAGSSGAPAQTAAAAPPPPAVSYGQQAGIQGTQDQIAALPGIYNPQRLAGFAQGARGLTDQGYYDSATVGQRQVLPDGTITYGVDAGPNGQAYRNSDNSIAAANNSRGTLFGSAAREQTGFATQGLNNARDAIIRGLGTTQDQTLADQAQRRASLGSDLAVAQGNYADWQAQQNVPPVTPAASAVSSATAARTTYDFNPNRTTLDARYGVGKYKVTRAGNGKYVVTPL